MVLLPMMGLYDKYIITRTDGKPVEGFHFVLKPKIDRAAREALRVYAFETPDMNLGWDIYEELRRIEEENQ